MAAAELIALLTHRSGAPEPSLLGWLARHVPPARWDLVRHAAAAFGGGPALPDRWPAIGAAVDEVAIARNLQRPGNAALPAFADRGAAGLTEEEAAWFLPQATPDLRREVLDRTLAAFDRALRSGGGWYAALILAHTAPYLGSRRSRVRRLTDQLADDFWRAHLTALTERDEPAPSAAAEVALAHPLTARLDQAARSVTTDDLHGIATGALADMVTLREMQPLPAFPATREQVETNEPLGAPALWVNNGVARPDDRRPLPVGRSLRTDTDYLFWFEIGDAPDPDSADRAPTPFELPEDATAGAILQVKLTSLPDEITVRPGYDTGELMVLADGRVAVAGQPDGSGSGGRRLFFPIRTPLRPGRHSLRCSIHHKGRLLQSRLLSAMVDVVEQERAWAVETIVDFQSGQHLHPAELAGMPGIDLSILVDDRQAPGGLTSVITAQGDAVAGIVLPGRSLQQQIERCRKALRTVSYEDKADPDAGDFHYDEYAGTTRPPDAFREDLIFLARRGWDAWVDIGSRIAAALERTGRADVLAAQPPDGTEDMPLWRLSVWLRQPRVIELANTADARILIPAAMLYDRPLAREAPYRICDRFLAALDAQMDLTTLACFRGDCPSYGDESVICPSGFWGFRHALGIPQSTVEAVTARAAHDVPGLGLTITYRDRPRCAVGRAGDFRREHPAWVSRLGDGALQVREDVATLLADLRRHDPEPHLVYFYCHGAFSEGMPVLQFDERGEDVLTPTDLAARVSWRESRPLVFLNACRSIATQPEHASSFIEALIQQASASGMVGTEIVTYEALAAEFAEQVLAEFVGRQRPLGEAMRTGRLALLAQGNPLGLIYTAYAPPHLTMRASASGHR